VFGKDSPHHILIHLDAKFHCDDVRDTRIAEARITPFDINNRANEFSRRPLGPRTPFSTLAVKRPVFSGDECSMELDYGGWLNSDGDTGQDGHLMPEYQILCEDRFPTTWPEHGE
jgi:hypothetical protein